MTIELAYEDKFYAGKYAGRQKSSVITLRCFISSCPDSWTIVLYNLNNLNMQFHDSYYMGLKVNLSEPKKKSNQRTEMRKKNTIVEGCEGKDFFFL